MGCLEPSPSPLFSIMKVNAFLLLMDSGQNWCFCLMLTSAVDFNWLACVGLNETSSCGYPEILHVYTQLNRLLPARLPFGPRDRMMSDEACLPALSLPLSPLTFPCPCLESKALFSLWPDVSNHSLTQGTNNTFARHLLLNWNHALDACWRLLWFMSLAHEQ